MLNFGLRFVNENLISKFKMQCFSHPSSWTPPPKKLCPWSWGGVCGHQVRVPALCHLCHSVLFKEHWIRLSLCGSPIWAPWSGTEEVADAEEVGLEEDQSFAACYQELEFYILDLV